MKSGLPFVEKTAYGTEVRRERFYDGEMGVVELKFGKNFDFELKLPYDNNEPVLTLLGREIPVSGNLSNLLNTPELFDLISQVDILSGLKGFSDRIQIAVDFIGSFCDCIAGVSENFEQYKQRAGKKFFRQELTPFIYFRRGELLPDYVVAAVSNDDSERKIFELSHPDRAEVIVDLGFDPEALTKNNKQLIKKLTGSLKLSFKKPVERHYYEI